MFGSSSRARHTTSPLAGLFGLGAGGAADYFFLPLLRPSTLALLYAELSPAAQGAAATNPSIVALRSHIWAELVRNTGGVDARRYVAKALREVV